MLAMIAGGVGDDGRGAARVGERGFDKSGGRVGADDPVAGSGQRAGEATLSASDIDREAPGSWQEVQASARGCQALRSSTSTVSYAVACGATALAIRALSLAGQGSAEPIGYDGLQGP
jgi:hypothetical protein